VVTGGDRWRHRVETGGLDIFFLGEFPPPSRPYQCGTEISGSRLFVSVDLQNVQCIHSAILLCHSDGH
jgi:hypothetical protein